MTTHTSFSVNLELKLAIEQAEALAKILNDSGRAEQAKALTDVIESARHLKFAIGVVGQSKRGKSTLINGLLGRSDDTLAPVNRFPATNVVSCFADGPKEAVRVLFAPDGKVTKTIPASDIKHFACEEFNPNNQKGVKSIEVIAPFPHLGKNVVLVDTPGADNALSNLHDIVLLDFLPRLDAVIFLVTADVPLLASELELLKQVKQSDVKKVLFAINKADKCDPEQLSQGMEHNRKALGEAGFGDAPIFTISAKNYQEKRTDDGTEQLLFAIGEMIGEGRAKAIVERLNDIVCRNKAETKEELTTELRLCEMTSEEAATEKDQLIALRKRLAAERPRLESKFRSAWKNALSDFEDALPVIEKRMVSEYGELVERTPALKLQALGQTVHTDVLKRLDELLEPHASKLREELDQAGKALEVDYSQIPSLASRQSDPVTKNMDIVKSTAEIAMAGIPAAVGAVVLGSLPGLVGSAIAAAAPAVVAVTLNPFTWFSAAATGAGALAVNTTAGAVAMILSPLAVIGAPLLIGYAGYRVFTTWKSKLAQSKNALSLAVKDLIIAAIAETRDNFKKLRRVDDAILDEFNQLMDTKLQNAERQMDELVQKRSKPEHVSNLKKTLQLIEQVQCVKTLPPPSGHQGSPPLFPILS